jgi:hypothetical protein
MTTFFCGDGAVQRDAVRLERVGFPINSFLNRRSQILLRESGRVFARMRMIVSMRWPKYCGSVVSKNGLVISICSSGAPASRFQHQSG